jgi:hypothetical protein
MKTGRVGLVEDVGLIEVESMRYGELVLRTLYLYFGSRTGGRLPVMHSTEKRGCFPTAGATEVGTER